MKTMKTIKKILYSTLLLTTTYVSAESVYFYKTDLFLPNSTNDSTTSAATPEGGAGAAVPDCVPLINGVTAIGTRSDNFCGHEGEDLIFIAVNTANSIMLQEAVQPNLNREWANFAGSINVTNITNGYSNTTVISNAYTASAALTCRDKGIEWYLPARNELQSVIYNQNQIPSDLRLGRTNYWTSSSVSGDNNRAVAASYSSSGLSFFNQQKRFNYYRTLCIKDGTMNNTFAEDISATVLNENYEVTRNSSFSARLFENINFENVYGSYTTTWSLSGDVPTWATFDANTTMLSGTPTELSDLGVWDFNVIVNITDEFRTKEITIPLSINVLNNGGCIESSDIPSLRTGAFDICGQSVDSDQYLAVVDGNLYLIEKSIKKNAYSCSYASHYHALAISKLFDLHVYTPYGSFVPPFPTTFSYASIFSEYNSNYARLKGIAPTVHYQNKPNNVYLHDYMYNGVRTCSSSSAAPNYVSNCGAYVVEMISNYAGGYNGVGTYKCRYSGCASTGPMSQHSYTRTHAIPNNLDETKGAYRACRI